MRGVKVESKAGTLASRTAIEHGLLLCSTDRDFARFEGLRWSDPRGGRSSR